MYFSLRRAFAVVKRQSTVALAALRRVSQAAMAQRTVSWSPNRRFKH
jgi:hypothetical protein